MGRTNPTYRDALRRLEREWVPMRRGLRREYQDDFDRLFARARGFADAAGYANPPRPERALVLSVLLAHEVEMRELRAELEGATGEDALEAGSGDGFEDGGDDAESKSEDEGENENESESVSANEEEGE